MAEGTRYQHQGELISNDRGQDTILDDDLKEWVMNSTALLVWNMCNGKRTKDQIVADLLAGTDRDPVRTELAVDKLLAKFITAGLVIEV